MIPIFHFFYLKKSFLSLSKTVFFCVYIIQIRNTTMERMMFNEEDLYDSDICYHNYHMVLYVTAYESFIRTKPTRGL